jgi:uncharacterized membrane protein
MNPISYPKYEHPTPPKSGRKIGILAIALIIIVIFVVSIFASSQTGSATPKNTQADLSQLQYKCVLNNTLQANNTYFLRAWNPEVATLAECDVGQVEGTNMTGGNCHVVQFCYS